MRKGVNENILNLYFLGIFFLSKCDTQGEVSFHLYLLSLEPNQLSLKGLQVFGKKVKSLKGVPI